MRPVIVPALFVPLILGTVPRPRIAASPGVIEVNDNRRAAGVLRNGVLTVRLEVRQGEWHPDRATDPGIVVRAFAEEGKNPSVPGPLIRVPEGTEIHATVRNTLPSGTLQLRGLSTRGAGTNDTISIAAGVSREITFNAGAPGTYFYAATVDGASVPDAPGIDAELNGAIVIDPRGASAPRDRIFVLGLWTKISRPGGIVNLGDVLRFTINGKSWPNTERLTYSVGDTVRFRVINTSVAVHPMHLHGFFFTVDSRGNELVDTVYAKDAPPYRVVTERLAPARTMSLVWTPDRAGNWLFHCHDNFHITRNPPLDGSTPPGTEQMHIANHATDMMGGLVMGIEVRGPDRSAQGASDADRRRLRLVARVDTGGTPSEPAYGYALDQGPGPAARAPLVPGPTLLLKRGQPVAITVVNELPEATAVHWHGIELESYFDGVADLSGQGNRIAPAIQPRDSFVARFTPPRSGTFIYHPHADEVRQQTAGLSGALLVVDDPATYDASHDIVVLITTPRRADDAAKFVLVNGAESPPPLELKAGDSYRLRLINIHTFRPSMILRVAGNNGPLVWRALAKDGMDLPSVRAVSKPAVQQLSNGETYDYLLTPPAAGDYQLTISAGAGALLNTILIRVH